MKVVAIVGSRDYPRKADVGDEVARLLLDEARSDVTVISGGARGVDTWAIEYAKAVGFETTVYPADWDGLGSRAGYVRNAKMVEVADEVIALWDGTSKGTRHTIDLALAKRKNLKVVFGETGCTCRTPGGVNATCPIH